MFSTTLMKFILGCSWPLLLLSGTGFLAFCLCPCTWHLNPGALPTSAQFLPDIKYQLSLIECELPILISTDCLPCSDNTNIMDLGIDISPFTVLTSCLPFLPGLISWSQFVFQIHLQSHSQTYTHLLIIFLAFPDLDITRTGPNWK